MTTPPRVLLVCSDLFFLTQLRSAAQAAGAAVDVELSAARIGQRLSGGGYALVAIDLEMAGVELPELMAGLADEGRPAVVAFGPHVRAALLKGAREAGCDHVVPRSMAVELVAGLAAQASRTV